MSSSVFSDHNFGVSAAGPVIQSGVVQQIKPAPSSSLRQLAVWQLILESVEQQTPVMLLYVLESNGSSPGRQGFSMAVNLAGEMAGSIGGGIMEHKFVEMARQTLADATELFRPATSIKKQIHNKAAAKHQSGMICSGDQTIVLFRVPLQAQETVQQIIGALQDYNNGTLSLSPERLHFSGDVPETDHFFEMRSQQDWLYREKIGYKNILYIIGGGHCALALSKLMSGMDFYIHLFEDRGALHTLAQNTFVHQKTIVEDYSALGGLLPGGDNHYVVVMTFGYRTDDLAVRALLKKSFAYFGVLGSSSKIEKMFSGYIAEGLDSALLAPIEAPAGLSIKSQTPEEIAVSIAAAIIKIKNSR